MDWIISIISKIWGFVWSIFFKLIYLTILLVLGAESHAIIAPMFKKGYHITIYDIGKIAFIGIFWFIIIYFIISRIIDKRNADNCPSCKKRKARNFIDQEILSKEYFEKTVMKECKTKNKAGEVTGSIEMPVQVKMVKVTARDIYECVFCGHKWAIRYTREIEQN